MLIPFQDPEPFQEFTYPTVLSAKRAIADFLNQPLAKLNEEQMAFINQILIDAILSKQIDNLEPTLTRHGYNVKNLAEQFNTKPAEIRSLFKGQLDAVRAQDLREQMLEAGLPI